MQTLPIEKPIGVDANRLGGFALGTPVQTGNGVVPIEQLKVGDFVISDPSSIASPIKQMRGHQDFVLRRISRAWAVEPQPLLEVMILCLASGIKESIRATSRQLFYEDPRGWLCSEQLGTGNCLVNTAHGNTMIRKVRTPGAIEPAIALEIEDYGTFFVGQIGVWVRDQGNILLPNNDPRPH